MFYVCKVDFMKIMSRSVANVTSSHCSLYEDCVGSWIPECKTQNNHVKAVTCHERHSRQCALRREKLPHAPTTLHPASCITWGLLSFWVHLNHLWYTPMKRTWILLCWTNFFVSYHLMSTDSKHPFSGHTACHLLDVCFFNPIITRDMSECEEQSLHQVPNSMQTDVFLNSIFKFNLIKIKNLPKTWKK